MSLPATDRTPSGDLRTISFVGVAHGTSHFFHLMLPPLFPWLMQEFSLNFTQAGALMTVFFVVSGIGQALAGFVVDRAGARWVLFSGVALLALSGFVLAAAQNYAMLALAAAVAGLGNSVFHPADFTVLNRRVSQARLGHAFSVHGLSGNLGWAAAPLFMAGIAAAAGWRAAAIGAGAVGCLLLVLLAWQREALAVPVQPHHADPGAVTAGPGGAFAFLGLATVWLCFAYFLVTTVAFGALQNYTPAALANLYGLSLASATAGISALMLGGAAGMAAGGFFIGRGIGHDRIIMASLGFAGLIALLLAASVAPAWSVLPLMALMGFGGGFAGPSRDMLVREAATGTLGPHAYGRVYGFVYSGLDVGLASAPLVFGPLMDQGRFQAAFVGIGLLQILAISTALRVGARSRSARAAAETA